MHNFVSKLAGFVLLLTLLPFSLSAQTPAHYVHNPANAGVNNIFFHATLSGKFCFVYTRAELVAAGITGSYTIGSIWFRHNVVRTVGLTNFRLTLGHTSNTSPGNNFANNFNRGTPTVALNQASYSYVSRSGTWNQPANNWTETVLTSPFTYNGTDNLVVQVEFSASNNSSLTFYADNGGTPITVYANSPTATTASANTARPMFGLSAPAVTAPPAVNFGSSDTVICPGDCITFTDSTDNLPTAWRWSFPGGSRPVDSAQNPASVCYANPGTYTVQLIASNGFGADTTRRTITVAAAPTLTLPSIDSTACVGDRLTFTAGPATGAFQWIANGQPAGNAATFDQILLQPGPVNVLGVVTENGCADSAEVQVVVNPRPNAQFTTVNSPPYCAGTVIQLQRVGGAAGDATWLLDGTPAGTGSNFVTGSLPPNTYTLSLAIDSAGCQDTASMSFTVRTPPTAVFTTNATDLCAGGSALFTNGTPAGGGISYRWLENGTPVSASWSLQRSFPTAGQYRIQLIADDGFCMDSSIVFLLEVFDPPTAGFSLPGAPFCAGDSVEPQDQSQGAQQYTWLLDGNVVATRSNPIVSTNIPGNYLLTQIVSSGQGCSDTLVRTLSFGTLPVVGFSSTRFNNTAAFTNTTTNGQSYLWNFGDGNTSTNPNPSHTYNAPGVYTVCLTATSPDGCTAENCQEVDVTVSIDRRLLDELSVYPNPATDRLRVGFGNQSFKLATLTLYDLRGRRVGSWEKAAGLGELSLPVSKLAAGIYQLEIRIDGRRAALAVRVE